MKATRSPVAMARKLIAMNTVNPPGRERACAEYIGRMLEDAGFTVAYYQFDTDRVSLVARLEGNGNTPPLCLSGHLDTVPLGTAPWKRDPFRGEIEGDRIYGRGASDMKGGVAAMLLTALRMSRPPALKSGLTLVFTAGEETGCQGAMHLAGLGSVLGTTGGLIVGEPTSNYPMVGHKGALRLEIWTKGVSAHGSMPEQGDNAIHKAAAAVMQLKDLDFGVAPHPLLGEPTLNIGTISGGMSINSVPDQANIGVDIRLVPGQKAEDVLGLVRSALSEEVQIMVMEQAGSIATDHAHPFVQSVYKDMEALLSKRPQPATAPYFTDASILTPALGHPPTLIMGPGESTMAHKTDEFCQVSKIEEALEAYTRIARRWCRGE